MTFAVLMQVINILTLGSPTGTGVFFPNGLNGAIKTPTGYDSTYPGLDAFPNSCGNALLAVAVGLIGHSLCAHNAWWPPHDYT